MKDSIDYSKFDIKECIKQALFHCNKIDKIYSHIDMTKCSGQGPFPSSLHFIWYQHENIKRQLEIISKIV
jgi:hypothetical protein